MHLDIHTQIAPMQRTTLLQRFEAALGQIPQGCAAYVVVLEVSLLSVIDYSINLGDRGKPLSNTLSNSSVVCFYTLEI